MLELYIQLKYKIYTNTFVLLRRGKSEPDVNRPNNFFHAHIRAAIVCSAVISSQYPVGNLIDK